MARKVLLVCGIMSSLLYAAMNVFFPMLYEDYSSVSQTVSELAVISGPLWAGLGAAYSLFLSAFGCGVWMSARRNRPLRIAGGLMVAYSVISFTWPLAPMDPRGAELTLTGTMHIVLAMVAVLSMALAIGFGAAAFGKRSRLYSIATLVILFAFGVLTGLDGPRVAANLPTPWVGVWERINIGVFLLWVVVLAVALLRELDRKEELRR
ncbi:MAG: DUF998 domain-containing protein [Pseudomonadota bacterium]